MFIDMHDVVQLTNQCMSKYNTRIILLVFVVLCVKTLQVCNLPKTKILKFTQTKIVVLY